MNVESFSEFAPDGRSPVVEDPYTVVLGLEAGDSVPGHTHPGQDILFAVFEGSLDLSVGDETRTLEPGDFANFEGDSEIAVNARADSKALVVFGEG
jgi:quercetin dioxygenase-like cupin family protein